MFLTNDGAFATNPITAEQGCVLIACTGIANTLVLSEFATDQPYETLFEAFTRSDGRGLTGSLRLKGNNYPPTRIWVLNFVVSAAQLELFRSILATQRLQQVLIEDRWELPVSIAPVWIDVDGRYATKRYGDWLLQFTAKEEI
jgi:hypothetical protein